MAAKKKPAAKSGPVVETSAMSPPDNARERKYRAEDALRTLGDAERIRSDKALMGDVDKARKARIKELEGIKVETSPQTMGKRGK